MESSENQSALPPQHTPTMPFFFASAIVSPQAHATAYCGLLSLAASLPFIPINTGSKEEPSGSLTKLCPDQKLLCCLEGPPPQRFHSNTSSVYSLCSGVGSSPLCSQGQATSPQAPFVQRLYLLMLHQDTPPTSPSPHPPSPTLSLDSSTCVSRQSCPASISRGRLLFFAASGLSVYPFASF